MRLLSHPAPVLLEAALLHMPARRLRALARSEDPALQEWLEKDVSKKVAHARHQAREAATRLSALGAAIVSIADGAYPAGLRELSDPPAFLCARGALPQRGIAIVGSRTPPPEAAVFAFELAKACAEPVISGLATGIDAAAHRGALEGGKPTLAYVATGLGVTYPAHHKALEETIVAAGGGVASERLPDEPVTKWALVHRDRLQAAHARAVILVCSEAGGGALQTMLFAKALGRPRFVLARYAGDAYAGNAQAKEDGALALPFDVARACRLLA